MKSAKMLAGAWSGTASHAFPGWADFKPAEQAMNAALSARDKYLKRSE